jgi:hypothetical protein
MRIYLFSTGGETLIIVFLAVLLVGGVFSILTGASRASAQNMQPARDGAGVGGPLLAAAVLLALAVLYNQCH